MDIYADLHFIDVQAQHTSVVQQNSNLNAKEIESIKSFQSDLIKHPVKRVSTHKNEDITPAKRKSLNGDLIKNDIGSKKQKLNQKEVAQRYRQNLKERCFKVETELQVECEKNEKLKTISSSLQSAITSLAKSLINHTKIDNVDSLLNALKSNGLNYAAEQIAESVPVKPVIPKVFEVAPASPIVQTSIQVQVYPESPKVTEIEHKGVEAKVVVQQQQQPVYQQPWSFSKPVIISEDEDCTVNRFQELFSYDEKLSSFVEDPMDYFIDSALSTSDDINFSSEDFELLMSTI